MSKIVNLVGNRFGRYLLYGAFFLLIFGATVSLSRDTAQNNPYVGHSIFQGPYLAVKNYFTDLQQGRARKAAEYASFQGMGSKARQIQFLQNSIVQDPVTMFHILSVKPISEREATVVVSSALRGVSGGRPVTTKMDVIKKGSNWIINFQLLNQN